MIPTSEGDPPPLAAFLPRSADRLHRLFESLDRSFAELWSTHITRLLTRPQIDARTRYLVLTAQYTATQMQGPLEENLEAALQAGADPRELLEAVLQCYVYTGPWVVASACETYEGVTSRRPEPADESSPPEAGRRLDRERETWSPADRADPRLEGLIERYGWHGISTGLRLRPGHHLDVVDTLDALDGEFLQAWLDAVYDGMYGRGVLDDRTRLLCVVGATLALGEGHQSRRHMRAALRSGASPRELLEVIFQTTAVFGHPHVMPAAIDDLILIVDDEGRLGELVDPDRATGVLRLAEARAARRNGVQDHVTRS